MFSKRSLSVLSKSEKHFGGRWLRSGQCLRCFRASRRRATDDAPEKHNERGTPVNAPNHGRTRHQRSAMISEEVKMLQREHPSPSFGEPDPNTQRPPGASQTVDSEVLGQSSLPGRMGENNTISQEGPMAQGVGRVSRTGEEPRDDSGIVRGVRAPEGIIEEPSQGGANVLETAATTVQVDTPTKRVQISEENRAKDFLLGQEGQQSAQAFATANIPARSLSHSDILRCGSGTSTIAAKNFEGVVLDHINSVAGMGQPESFRHPPSLARKLIHGQFVSFDSHAEKAAVEEAAKQISGRFAERVRLEGKNVEETPPKQFVFRSLSEKSQKTMVEKLVTGEYDRDGLLEGKEKHKQPLLNEIAKTMIMNGSYYSTDRDRFVGKVRSLLPMAAAPSQQQQRKGGKPRQKS